jgi:hypothetical protein
MAGLPAEYRNVSVEVYSDGLDMYMYGRSTISFRMFDGGDLRKSSTGMIESLIESHGNVVRMALAQNRVQWRDFVLALLNLWDLLSACVVFVFYFVVIWFVYALVYC